MEQRSSSSKEATAPHPEDNRKPDSVTDLDKRSWKFIAKRALKEFSQDECLDLAAALTYYAVLALFPAMLAIISLLGLIGQDRQGTDALMQMIRDVAPSAADTLQGRGHPVDPEPAAGFTSGDRHRRRAVVGIGLRRRLRPRDEPDLRDRRGPALLEAPAGHAAHHPHRGAARRAGLRRPRRIRPGSRGRSATRSESETPPSPSGTSSNGRSSSLVVVLVVAHPVLRHAQRETAEVPLDQHRRRRSPSSCGSWCRLGFGFYVANFSSYNKTYGILAGVIVFLLWLWITNLALLFGAEIDSEIERGRQLQGGIAAEEELQLPPRDTKASDKLADKERADLEEARRIRTDNSSSR